MQVKILRNTQGAKCWYAGRIGEVFSCHEYDHLGMRTGDFETVDPACGKRALIAAEDGEVQPEKIVDGKCPHCGHAVQA